MIAMRSFFRKTYILFFALFLLWTIPGAMSIHAEEPWFCEQDDDDVVGHPTEQKCREECWNSNGTPGSCTQTEAQTPVAEGEIEPGESAENPRFTPEQREALQRYGINPESLPAGVTSPQFQSCVQTALGEARVQEITNGSTPTAGELLKAAGCVSQLRQASQQTTPAEGFVPLTNLPGLTTSPAERTLADYLNVLYRLSVGIAALAAVIKLTLAGVKYMATDAFSSKEEAKRDITASLFGLLIILSTVLILQLIYPGILDLNVLQKLPVLEAVNKSNSMPPGIPSYQDPYNNPTPTGPRTIDVLMIPPGASSQDPEAVEFRRRCAERGGTIEARSDPRNRRSVTFYLYCVQTPPAPTPLPPGE